jgi:energy-coupling factor transporter ATP-binding protein EcfA2
MLETRNLNVRYPDHTCSIINNISFKVGQGETLWLKGANGTGKTTLLYACCNIIPQEIAAERTGEVYLENKLLNEVNLNRLNPELSMILANPQWELFFNTPKDEIAFTLENLGLSQSDIQSRLDYSVTLFDLANIIDTDSHTLSRGWQKVVSLAVHAAIRPKVLLIDEPLSGLSETCQKRVLNWLREYLNDGGCLVIAEHNEIIQELGPAVLMLG